MKIGTPHVYMIRTAFKLSRWLLLTSQTYLTGKTFTNCFKEEAIAYIEIIDKCYGPATGDSSPCVMVDFDCAPRE